MKHGKGITGEPLHLAGGFSVLTLLQGPDECLAVLVSCVLKDT